MRMYVILYSACTKLDWGYGQVHKVGKFPCNSLHPTAKSVYWDLVSEAHSIDSKICAHAFSGPQSWWHLHLRSFCQLLVLYSTNPVLFIWTPCRHVQTWFPTNQFSWIFVLLPLWLPRAETSKQWECSVTNSMLLEKDWSGAVQGYWLPFFFTTLLLEVNLTELPLCWGWINQCWILCPVEAYPDGYLLWKSLKKSNIQFRLN